MSNRVLMVFIALLGAAFWAALVALMNLKPPTMPNRALFLGVLGMAVLCTITPISYALHSRLAAPRGRSGDFARALRQGFLAGVLVITLMALRFLYILTPFSGIVLTCIVILVEVLFSLRRD